MSDTSYGDESILIQCPSCLTRFSIKQQVLAGVSDPRFHCSRCDNIFRIKDTPQLTPTEASEEELPQSHASNAEEELQEQLFANSDGSTQVSEEEGYEEEEYEDNDEYEDENEDEDDFDDVDSEYSDEDDDESEEYEDEEYEDDLSLSDDESEDVLDDEVEEGLATDEQVLESLLGAGSSSAVGTQTQKSETKILEGSSLVDSIRNQAQEGDFEKALSAELASSKKNSEQAVKPKATQESLPLAKGDKAQPKTTISGENVLSRASSLEALFEREKKLADEMGATTIVREPAHSSASGSSALPVMQKYGSPMLFIAPVILLLLSFVALSFAPSLRASIATLAAGAVAHSTHEPAPSGVILETKRFESVILASGERAAVVRGELFNNSTQTLRRALLEATLFSDSGEIISTSQVVLGADLHGTNISNLTRDMIVDLQDIHKGRPKQLDAGSSSRFVIAMPVPQGSRPNFFSVRIYSVQSS